MSVFSSVASGDTSLCPSVSFFALPSPHLSGADATPGDDFIAYNQQFASVQNLTMFMTAAESVPTDIQGHRLAVESVTATATTTTTTTMVAAAAAPAATAAPKLEIIEQPIEKFRFRYKSEMQGTHGSLHGMRSDRNMKTYPEVRLDGFAGVALIRCSLFQADIDSPHAHQLVVRKGDKDECDPHVVPVSAEKGFVAEFQSMGIINTAKKYLVSELYHKKRNRLLFGMERCTLSDTEEGALRAEAEREVRTMNLNQVRLCFEAFTVDDNGTCTRIAVPVFTHCINNRKSVQTGELRICRLSSSTGSVIGGDDIILLVEKVSKKNIKVRFFEVDEEDETVWEAYGKFRECDVHHQFAIVCTTPPYKSRDIASPVVVRVELVRPSDDDRSCPPLSFKYKPREAIVSRKRRYTAVGHNGTSSSTMSSSELPTPVQEHAAISATMQRCLWLSAEIQHSRLPRDDFGHEQQLVNSEDFNQMMTKDSEELKKICLDLDLLNGDELEFDGPRDKVALTTTTTTAGRPAPTATECVRRAYALYCAARSSTAPHQPRWQALGQRVSDILAMFSTNSGHMHTVLHEVLMFDDDDDDDVTMAGNKVCTMLRYFHLEAMLGAWLDYHGRSCLHYACLYNRPALIRPLLLLGCDPNLQDNDGNTALHVAVQEDLGDVMAEFLSHLDDEHSTNVRIDLKLRNDDGVSALHLAIRNSSLEVIERLLKHDMQAALVCDAKDGNNALHMAVVEQNVPLIKAIVDLNVVDKEARNAAGSTAANLTRNVQESVRQEILEILSSTNSMKVDEIEEEESLEEASLVEGAEGEEVEEEENQEAQNKNEKLREFLDDEENFQSLCKFLDSGDKWRPLAKSLNVAHLQCLWMSAKGLMLYVHSNVHNIGYDRLVAALKAVDSEAHQFLTINTMNYL